MHLLSALRTVALDGLNPAKVPDTDRNRSWLGKLKNRLSLAGYPAMRIVAPGLLMPLGAGPPRSP